jgi:hypothetical protein
MPEYGVQDIIGIEGPRPEGRNGTEGPVIARDGWFCEQLDKKSQAMNAAKWSCKFKNVNSPQN